MRKIRQRPRPRSWIYLWTLISLVIVACSAQTVAPPVTLTISAAASLNEVFPAIGQRWTEATGHPLLFNFGSTGQLAQQIERGAPVDVFAAADQATVVALDQQGLLLSATKAIYGQGRLTLWQREESPLSIETLADLTQPAVRRVAIANPDHAPYGLAAREALQAVGLWETLQPKLVFGENIQQAQQYAATGNVEVAIAALSMSLHRPGRWTLIPAELHQPLVQMLAVPKRAPHPELAASFVAFVTAEPGRTLLQHYGFEPPGEAPSS